MAFKARGAPKKAGATLSQCLAEIRAGPPAPVYLFDGDAFLALRAARELAQALIPEAERELSLVELDAAASPAEVAAELATGALFGGGKVVLVQEPAFLSSKEDAAGAFASAAKSWSDGRQRDAARKLLALAVKAGVARALVPGEDGNIADEVKRALANELGFTLDAAAARFIDEAGRYARERELKVAKGDDAGALDAVLAQGFPKGHVLVIAAGKVDGRLPLVKKLAAAGRRVTTQLEKEGMWDAQRLVLGPVLDTLLAGTGKRVDHGAEARLAECVGEDARALASEVQKLVAYVGDRQVITADDVDRLVPRVAADPFFAFGNAVEARDLPEALAVLDRSLGDGASPFMLLGSLASTVRRLVVERERGRKAAGDRHIGSFDAWQATVWPHIPKEEIGEKKPFGFWKKFEAAQRYQRDELLRALVDLAESDLAMKSGADGRPFLEKVLWRLMSKPPCEVT